MKKICTFLVSLSFLYGALFSQKTVIVANCSQESVKILIIKNEQQHKSFLLKSFSNTHVVIDNDCDVFMINPVDNQSFFTLSYNHCKDNSLYKIHYANHFNMLKNSYVVEPDLFHEENHAQDSSDEEDTENSKNVYTSYDDWAKDNL